MSAPDDRVLALVPMAFVTSVARSIEFYARLGFQVQNTHTPDGMSEIHWAYLVSGRAQLMLAKASDRVVPDQQAVLFYTYCPDVAAMRERLVAAGLSAGEIAYPFFAPRGEFRLTDPDGYVVMVAHT